MSNFRWKQKHLVLWNIGSFGNKETRNSFLKFCFGNRETRNTFFKPCFRNRETRNKVFESLFRKQRNRKHSFTILFRKQRNKKHFFSSLVRNKKHEPLVSSVSCRSLIIWDCGYCPSAKFYLFSRKSVRYKALLRFPHARISFDRLHYESQLFNRN